MALYVEIKGRLKCKFQLPIPLRWIIRILILIGIGGVAGYAV